MAESEGTGWAFLPGHVVAAIFSYLRVHDRAQAALTCHAWADAFWDRALWKNVQFKFYLPGDVGLMKCVNMHGEYIESAFIELDQFQAYNRENACKVIQSLTEVKVRRLRNLAVKFTGENPYFYSGQEFVNALVRLLEEPAPDVEMVNTLEKVDLGGLLVAIDDSFITLLSEYHSTSLSRLDIQNRQLVCKVTPECMLKLVQQCRSLQDLRVYKISISAEVLKAFTEKNRAPLDRLSLVCRSEERFLQVIPTDVWLDVRSALPELKVTLLFDHTCLIESVVEVMDHNIPVRDLWLETYMFLHDVVLQRCRLYVENLEKLVLLSPLPKTSQQFEDTIVDFVRLCPNLSNLHVFTVLQQSTVQEIFNSCPRVKQNEKYTLRCEPGIHPWIPGKGCYEDIYH